MEIINRWRMAGWIRTHRDARNALLRWQMVTVAATWNSLVDVHATFRTADAVIVASGREVYVFNIRGNHYRLLTALDFAAARVDLLEFLTHAEYSRNQWFNRL